jgi:hypothetical protein
MLSFRSLSKNYFLFIPFMKKVDFSEEIYSFAAAAVPLGVFIVQVGKKTDLSGWECQYINPFGASVFKLDSDDIAGKTLEEFFPKAFLKEIEKPIRQAFSSKETTQVGTLSSENGFLHQGHHKIYFASLDQEHAVFYTFNITLQIEAEEFVNQKMDELNRMNKVMAGRDSKLAELEKKKQALLKNLKS